MENQVCKNIVFEYDDDPRHFGLLQFKKCKTARFLFRLFKSIFDLIFGFGNFDVMGLKRVTGYSIHFDITKLGFHPQRETGWPPVLNDSPLNLLAPPNLLKNTYKTNTNKGRFYLKTIGYFLFIPFIFSWRRHKENICPRQFGKLGSKRMECASKKKISPWILMS